ncbi:MAG: glycerophosphodiester phosphodiesterase family protein [Sedimenticola sp.]
MRGYAEIEHSPSAFKQVNKFEVKYFEVDTRVTSDGEIFVYHDSDFKSTDGIKTFNKMNGNQVKALAHSNGEGIATLLQALTDFKAYSKGEQIFCIDIKDFGFEEVHLKVVRDVGVEDQVVFVSWIPQTLIRLSELGAQTPLILSHWNLKSFKWIGSLISRALKNKTIKVGPFVLIGNNVADHELGVLSHGFQHALVTTDIPNHLLEILKQSRGGICVHTSVVQKRLRNYCSKNSLSLWVFSVTAVDEYTRYAKLPDVDVVFCDDAPTVSLNL